MSWLENTILGLTSSINLPGQGQNAASANILPFQLARVGEMQHWEWRKIPRSFWLETELSRDHALWFS